MQVWGVNFWENFLPVVNWMSVQILLTLTLLHGLEACSIDFALAFPQTELDQPVYMDLPIGCEVPGAEKGEYVIVLQKFLYGLKQASLNWFEMLKKGLLDFGFRNS